MSKHYSYGVLIRNRMVLAGLTLGLVTIMLGVFIELTLTSQRSTISPTVQKLIEPLNPLLDIETVERLEEYPLVTREAIREAIAPRDVAGVGAVAPNTVVFPGEEATPPVPETTQPIASPEPASQPPPTQDGEQSSGEVDVPIEQLVPEE